MRTIANRGSIMQSFYFWAADIKIGWGVAIATMGAGASTAYEPFHFIPDDIGKLAALVGLILSVVLLYFHSKIKKAELRRVALEIEKLEREVAALPCVVIREQADHISERQHTLDARERDKT